jgi:hypothetical protein
MINLSGPGTVKIKINKRKQRKRLKEIKLFLVVCHVFNNMDLTVGPSQTYPTFTK